jgi:site-specific DNA-methyltransferase (adenine-specific)
MLASSPSAPTTLPPQLQPLSPHWQDEQTTLYQADSLRLLAQLPTGAVDAVITDPPYSSGGMTRSDRTATTNGKYALSGTDKTYPDFLGDNKDQRGYHYWSALWFSEAFRVTKPGGIMLVFTDWRQLPTVSDAIQAGGWVWRGIVPWDKTEGVRPQKGWFRAQCEYILTATSGSLGLEQSRPQDAPCLPGFYRQSVLSQQKRHLTGKPYPLMCELLRVLRPGSTVLDPFAGSGTTLLAARSQGHRAIGCEQHPDYLQIITEELQAVTLHQLSP